MIAFVNSCLSRGNIDWSFRELPLKSTPRLREWPLTCSFANTAGPKLSRENMRKLSLGIAIMDENPNSGCAIICMDWNDRKANNVEFTQVNPIRRITSSYGLLHLKRL